tara:strand:+ start:5619 stop:9830 length:4212 start_codon:yes stop_codon:yes gene_type:complete
MTQRLIGSYWDGDSWEDILDSGSSKSAIMSLKLTESIGTPSTLFMRLNNSSTTPFSGASGQSDGPWTGIFTDFMPIRLRDGETNQIYFYGVVYKTAETYEDRTGMVLEISCTDYLAELRDNTTSGAKSYTILNHATASGLSPADHISYSGAVSAEYDAIKNVFTTAISSRGGLIKSLISKATNNLTIPTSASTDARFIDSTEKYQENDIYHTGRKSFLSHVSQLAAEDPHNLEADEQIYGYNYYVSPNFTSTATSHKPKACFNYFKRAKFPTTIPANYGLSIQHPASKNFTQDGRSIAMSKFSFERPREGLITEATVTFPASSELDDGVGVPAGTSVVVEVLTAKAANTSINGDGVPTGTSPNFTWKDKAITGGTAGSHSSEMLMAYSTLVTGSGLASDAAATSFAVDSVADFHTGQTIVVSHSGDNPEEMKITGISGTTLTVIRNTDGTGAHTHSDDAHVYVADVARMQYINKTSGISNTSPAYVLISEIDEGLSESNQTSIFAENKIFVGRSSGATFTLKSRPKTSLGVKRGIDFQTGNLKEPRAIREKLAANLVKKSTTTLKGSFSTIEKPRFYVDISPSAVSTSSSVDTATLASTVSALDGAISSTTATTITVDSDATTTLSAGEVVNVDSEMMRIKSITNATTIEVDRGVGSTTAATHTTTTVISGPSPFSYGITIGTTLVELDSAGDPSTTYGYVSAMTGTTISTTLNTGTVSTAKTYRFYIPVRAGDFIKVRNDLVNVNTNMIVLGISLIEQDGVHTTEYQAYGSESASTAGDTAEVDYTAAKPSPSLMTSVVQAVSEDEQLPPLDNPSQMQVNATNALTTTVFTSKTGDLLDRVSWAEGSLTVGSKRFTIDAGETGDMNSDGRLYYIYYPGSGTSLLTVEKTAWKNLDDVKNGFATLVAWAKYGDPESQFKMIANDTDIPTKGDPAKFIASGAMTTALLKKGAQPWTTTVEFKKFPQSDSSVYNKFSWGNGTAGNTAGYISFGTSSSDTHPVDSGNSNTDFSSIGGANLSSGLSDNTTYYCFLDISDSSSAYPVGVTTDYRVPYQDNKILMATVIVGTSQDNTNTKGNSPTILPFNGKIPTMSVGALAANSIIADNIQAGTITADHITSGVVTTRITADMSGVTMNTAGQIMSGKSSYGSGTGYILEYNSATPRFDIGSSSQYFRWDGTNVLIKGDLDLTTGTTGGGDKAGIHIKQSSQGFESYNGGADAGSIKHFSGDGTLLFRRRFYSSYVYDNFYVNYAIFLPNNGAILPVNTVSGQRTSLGNDTANSLFEDIFIDGDLNYGGSLTSTSDARVKTNIIDLTNSDSLQLISSLQPRQYGRSDSPKREGKLFYGLVAQEVETVLNNLGIDKTTWAGIKLPDTEDKMRRLEYDQLIAPLIGAIKELKARIEALES